MTDSDRPSGIGERLRQLRRTAGLSAAELGRRAALVLGRPEPISASAVRNQENGTNGVPLVSLEAYAKVLKIDFAEIVSGEYISDLSEHKDPDSALNYSNVDPSFPVSGNWIELSLPSDKDAFSHDLAIWVPGFHGIELTSHLVLDDSMEPIYSQGERLITAACSDVGTFDDDHVLIWAGSGIGLKGLRISARQLHKTRTRIELRGIGSAVREPITFVDGGQLVDRLWADRVVIATFNLLPKSRRALIELPPDGVWSEELEARTRARVDETTEKLLTNPTD